jgi:hypothetical protein
VNEVVVNEVVVNEVVANEVVANEVVPARLALASAGGNGCGRLSMRVDQSVGWDSADD